MNKRCVVFAIARISQPVSFNGRAREIEEVKLKSWHTRQPETEQTDGLRYLCGLQLQRLPVVWSKYSASCSGVEPAPFQFIFCRQEKVYLSVCPSFRSLSYYPFKLTSAFSTSKKPFFLPKCLSNVVYPLHGDLPVLH